MNRAQPARKMATAPRRLLLVFLSALLVRAAFVLSMDIPFVNPDSEDYISLADNLIATRSYSLNGSDPDSTRAPGYPFFLAALNFPFGKVRVGPSVAAQVLLDSMNAALVSVIALGFCSSPFALAAGVAYALHPVFCGFSRLLLSETLFMSLWLLFLLASVKALSSGSAAKAALSGAILAAAVLVRPAHMFYFVALAPVFFLSALPWRRALMMWVLLLLVFQALILPWKERNRLLVGKPIITTGAGIAFWAGSLLSYPTRADLAAAWPRGDYKSPEAESFFAGAAQDNWRANWPKLLADMPHRLRRFWLSSHSSVFDITQPDSYYSAAGRWLPLAAKYSMLALQAVLLAAALAGACVLRRRWRALLFLLMPAAYATAHILNDWGPSRYHLPAIPCLLITIAWAAEERLRGRSHA